MKGVGTGFCRLRYWHWRDFNVIFDLRFFGPRKRNLRRYQWVSWKVWRTLTQDPGSYPKKATRAMNREAGCLGALLGMKYYAYEGDSPADTGKYRKDKITKKKQKKQKKTNQKNKNQKKKKKTTQKAEGVFFVFFLFFLCFFCFFLYFFARLSSNPGSKAHFGRKQKKQKKTKKKPSAFWVVFFCFFSVFWSVFLICFFLFFFLFANTQKLLELTS